jgi:hypothetical protein
MFLAAGLAMLVATGPGVALLGTFGSLVALSVASGGPAGVLMLRSPEPRTRAGSSCIAAMALIITLPLLTAMSAGSSWLASRPWKRMALEEGIWLTRSVWAVKGDIVRLTEPPVADALSDSLAMELLRDDPVITWTALPRAARVALVGEIPPTVLESACGTELVRDQLRVDPTASSWTPPWSRSGVEAGGAGREPAHRFLRRTHCRYDLLLIAGGDLPADVRHGPPWRDLIEWSVARTTTDGVVVLLVPMTGCSRAALEMDLDRLSRGSSVEFVGQSAMIATEPHLVIAFGRGNGWRRRWQTWTGS